MRYQTYLRERYQAIFGYLGGILFLIGLLIAAPLVILPFYPQEWRYAGGFLLPAVFTSLVGAGLWRWLRPQEGTGLSLMEGMVIILLAWLVVLGMGSVPFMLAHDMTLAQAVFESTSGWTSTGLTVVNVLEAPKIILFYRSWTQFAGAAGFAIIMLSALTGAAGTGLVAAEGRTDQLVPHVRRSASIVLQMYLAYTTLGIVALTIAGMTLFEAVNHAFAAIATGGFSTRPESIAYWDSVWIEITLIILMILGAINFLTAYTLLRGKWRAFVHNGEIRAMTFILTVSILALFAGGLRGLYADTGHDVRVAVFETVSALTTTGFNVVFYHPWVDFAWLIIILLMLVGGGSGSTAGAIKLHRVYALYKGLKWEIRRAFLPEHAVNAPSTWQGEHQQFISDRTISLAGMYAFLYLGTVFVGAAALSSYGYTLRDSLFEFASLLGNAGISSGITRADAPPQMLWTMSFGMFLGRLEFFTIVIGCFKLAQDLPQLVVPSLKNFIRRRAQRRQSPVVQSPVTPDDRAV